jgi:pyruvate/2-oxoglutarate dehydrogenase complex dihydrolipoamide acyltransferase (E2) component
MAVARKPAPIVLFLTLGAGLSAGALATVEASPKAAQAAVPPQTPANQSPAQASPPADPASSQFATGAGLLLATIKPASVEDYELVIRTLQDALSKDTDPKRQQAAKGWRVFKATEVDAKGNAVFIHVMMPALANFDYRPSLLIDELVKDLAADLLSRYHDAFAAPPTKLSLTEFAQMSVAPVEPKKPGGIF